RQVNPAARPFPVEAHLFYITGYFLDCHRLIPGTGNLIVFHKRTRRRLTLFLNCDENVTLPVD
ncbi:MAG TPA: hypothetical protein PKZ12_02155, partial [Smithellaceae bacterium]|nr:hypothetical protein [Smithellaceae bacterium]